jgi:hypothetical protein
VTVTVAVAAGAVDAAVNVSVLMVVAEAGLNAAETPVGKPAVLRPTAPANVPIGEMVITLLADCPGETVTEAGATAMEKSEAGLTVRISDADWLGSDPLVPVTVTVAGPVTAVAEAVNASVAVPPVVEAGVTTALTPVGNPVAPSATEPVKPPVRAIVIALVAVPPRITVALAAESENPVTVPMVTETMALLESVPLTPVIVTW